MSPIDLKLHKGDRCIIRNSTPDGRPIEEGIARLVTFHRGAEGHTDLAEIWDVRTMSVEFKAKYRRLLEKAIKALGWEYSNIKNVKGVGEGLLIETRLSGSFTIDLFKGRVTIQDRQQSCLNQLKQQYSKQALRRAAKLQGWQVKAKGQMKGVLRK